MPYNISEVGNKNNVTVSCTICIRWSMNVNQGSLGQNIGIDLACKLLSHPFPCPHTTGVEKSYHATQYCDLNYRSWSERDNVLDSIRPSNRPYVCLSPISWLNPSKGTTINDLGGCPEQIEKKKSRRPFSRIKFPRKKTNAFSIFPPPPRSLMVDP